MRLYDACFDEATALLKPYACRSLKTEGAPWPDGDPNQLVFRGDAACELGGGTLPAVSGLALTDRADLVPRDELLLYGPDLPDLRGDVPWARLTFLRVREEAMGEGERFYQAIRKIEYTRYHVSPRGFMLRISALSHRESARVSREALTQGLDLAWVGRSFLRAYHSHPAVEAVRIVWITEPDFPYGEAARLAQHGEDITKALDHLLKRVKMDCSACSLQNVCAEVEALCQADFPGP